MALSSNPFSAFLGKFTANQEVLTTVATASFLDRTHYSSSGHSGSGYHHYHYSSGKKKKKSIAMTALTLLSFLFFLNILQNCIQEHMNQMNPTVMVMQMQTTMASIRKSDRIGDDVGELFHNNTLPEEIESERSKNVVKIIDELETSTKPTRRKSNNESKKRKKGEKQNIEIKPTRPTMFITEEEYQYTQIPIKLKTVESYNNKRKP
ncbi:uncharacterized protein LOC123309799 [Coccinella septempunctata]|uniref:uncharacterized protein LOC123309799 n=1 Tax=Coccinella septempunctata TaxID=41139 RepID=UPI001D08AA6C|nr:uncharacterized protein LOC123309799 [Coccinella septempunctata]